MNQLRCCMFDDINKRSERKKICKLATLRHIFETIGKKKKGKMILLVNIQPFMKKQNFSKTFSVHLLRRPLYKKLKICSPTYNVSKAKKMR